MNIKTCFGISSCKGGVGKSTVACNIAITLANQGHKVGLSTQEANVHVELSQGAKVRIQSLKFTAARSTELSDPRWQQRCACNHMEFEPTQTIP